MRHTPNTDITLMNVFNTSTNMTTGNPTVGNPFKYNNKFAQASNIETEPACHLMSSNCMYS